MFTIKYLSAIKRNKLLVDTTTWINLRNIGRNEKSFIHVINDHFCEILEQTELIHGGKASGQCLPGKG